jgi:hypothetical protein
MFRLTNACALVALASLSSAAVAGLTQSATVSPGGFSQSAWYAGTCGCSGPDIGADLSVGYGTAAGFNEQAFSGNATAVSSVSGSTAAQTSATSGSARLGVISVRASNTQTNNSFFVQSATDAGFKDRFTITHPTLNGQAGVMTFAVTVNGTISASGFAGSGSIIVETHKNGAQVAGNPALTSFPGSSIATVQNPRWSAASGPDVVLPVNAVAVFAVPFTFGTPFDVSVFARAVAGQRSFSGVAGTSTAIVDFSNNGVVWSGIQGIYQGTTPVSGASISALSNTNWNTPASICDSLDFNGDGNIDPTDVDAYFSVLGEGPCLPINTVCNDLDFNNDGNIDPADVDAYFSILGEGPCL